MQLYILLFTHNYTFLADDDDPVFASNKPTHDILVDIQKLFAQHWEYIAYKLISPEDVETIKHLSDKDINQKCFDMLKRWVEVKQNASYTELFKALKAFQLNRAVEDIKKTVLDIK